MRRSSATLLFSKLANVLNASLTSVSTFAVALGVGALEASAGRGALVPTAFAVEISLIDSRITSVEVASPETAATVVLSAALGVADAGP